jgi:DNA-binding transcriptional regulator GbsR (MarR family)
VLSHEAELDLSKDLSAIATRLSESIKTAPPQEAAPIAYSLSLLSRVLREQQSLTKVSPEDAEDLKDIHGKLKEIRKELEEAYDSQQRLAEGTENLKALLKVIESLNKLTAKMAKVASVLLV